MHKWILTIVCLTAFSIECLSQQWTLKRVEAQLGVGTTNIYGDMGGSPEASDMLFIKDITFRSTRPSLYLGIRYRLTPSISVKTTFNFGYSKTEDYPGSRNESRGFTSITNLYEISGTAEYYFISEQRRMRSAAIFNRRGMVNNYSSFAAYVFAGAGALIYKPQLDIPQTRPSDEYKYDTGFTLSIPVGVGIKYIISDDWMIGYEIGYHQTFTDFMDGFNTVYSNRPDVFWISSLSLSYRVPTSRRGLPIFLDRQWRRARL